MTEIYDARHRKTGERLDFPVEWTDESDAERTWRWDSEHSAWPWTPLTAELWLHSPWQQAVAVTFGGDPSIASRSFIANGYRYTLAGEGASQPPEYAARVAKAAPDVQRMWQKEWRPQMQQDAAALFALDYDALPLGDLVGLFDRMVEQSTRHMTYVMTANTLIGHNRSEFQKFCRARCTEESWGLIEDCLQGVPNVSFEAGARLWELAQLSRTFPAVRALLESADATDFLHNLHGLEGGKDFVASLDGWLESYGRRNGEFHELGIAPWIDAPETVIALLRTALTSESPRLAHARASQRRIDAIAALEASLPLADREHFRTLLEHASSYLDVREDRMVVLGLSRSSMRLPILAVGRRLAASGLLDKPEDAFFLYNAERLSAAEGLGSDLRQKVTERRAADSYWREALPPASIGAHAAKPLILDAASIKGTAASPGVITAIARVVLDLSEAPKLGRGEVLVARATAPLWTPLFGIAGAVVTDAGGMLSHCAIVAREYGLPAVVGTTVATQLIPDGALVRVDGNAGTVTLV